MRASQLVRRLAVGALWGAASAAPAQSLFVTQAPRAQVDALGRPVDAGSLASMSMLVVEPPRPRTFATHDQITIIIDETSRQQSEQSLDTKKDYDLGAQLEEFPSLRHLIELQFRNGDSRNELGLDVSANNKLKAEGTYERNDRFSARIAATIIDVKPNGVLVLEARKYIQKDDEIQTIVLSGNCRGDDVTTNNTVLSSQLADLSLISENEGEVKKSGSKGWIPKVLEAVFAF